MLGTIDVINGSPSSTETIGAEKGISAIVRGKLHSREVIGADAKHPGGGAIKKADACCICE